MILHARYEGIDLAAVGKKYHAEKSGHLKERYLAIKLSYQGYQTEPIADILSRNRVTVQTWLNQFNERGWEGLTFEDIPGDPSKLTPNQKQAF